MRLRPDQVEAVRSRVIANRRSRAFQQHEAQLEWVAVCMIGYSERVPRRIGDNYGAWPVRIATSNNPTKVAIRPDLESPIWEIRVLEMVWCPSDAHAKRLKTKLDTLLLGSTTDNRGLRHGWRDLPAEPEIVWPVLLGEALSDIRRREREFNIYTDEQRLERVSARMRGKIA